MSRWADGFAGCIGCKLRVSKSVVFENVPWTKPEEHDRVELVNIGNEKHWQHEEEQNVSEDKVGSEIAKLSDLAKVLTAGLGDGVPTKCIPLASPPRNVRCVRLELASEGQRNDELVDETLDGDDGDHSQQSLGEAPSFKEEHNFEECQEHDDGYGVGDCSEDRTEFLAA